MGLFTEDGVPKSLLRLLGPSLGPGEHVVQCALVSDATAEGTDLSAGGGTGALADVLAAAAQPEPSYLLALTDAQVFLFRIKRRKGDPLPTGHRRDQVRIDLRGRQIEPSHVVITVPGQPPHRYEVPEVFRRQVAAMAAALSAPRPPAASG